MSKLGNVKIPPAVVSMVSDLMHAAEEHFGGPGKGVSKKQWVVNAACAALANLDIPILPEWIEAPLKRAVVGLIGEVVWALAFHPGLSGEAPRGVLPD